MSRDPRHDILFEPVQIAPHRAKNRFFQVPHCNGMGTAYPKSMGAMRRTRAEGGWAVVCTEKTGIHRDGDLSPLDEGRLWDGTNVERYRPMLDGVHVFGALAGIQLSHQMRTLEAHFNVPLFVTKGRQMRLSRHGERLLETVRGSFDSIERRMIEANGIINPGHLKVAASTAIASSSIPAYASQFIIENELVDFTWMPLEEIDETVDVVIAYADIPDLGEADITYLSLNYFVVCTPVLSEGMAPPSTLTDLNDHVFIHGDYDGAEWKRFLGILGQRQIVPRANMYLGNYLLSNRAAKNGCGLAIADELMVHDELAAGTLIRPLPQSVPAPQPARIIVPARSPNNRLALHFRDWFIEKTADTLPPG